MLEYEWPYFGVYNIIYGKCYKTEMQQILCTAFKLSSHNKNKIKPMYIDYNNISSLNKTKQNQILQFTRCNVCFLSSMHGAS